MTGTARATAVDARGAGGFSDLDRHVARLVRRLAESGGLARDDAELLELTAALASRERGRGHSCLLLATQAGRAVTLGEHRLEAPATGEWRRRLLASGLVASPGHETGDHEDEDRGGEVSGAALPLVLDARDRLYLYRYWRAEQRLAGRLRRLAESGSEPDEGELEGRSGLFLRLFPDAATTLDRQAAAAAAALLSPLALVSGGPGTGKTTTALRLLALVLDARPGLRVALAAPTGKAATRLEESIGRQLEELDEDLRQRFEPIPRRASTLHRLLGYSHRRDLFHHHAGRPLVCDLLVIDEASMVDLLMMDAVLDALRPGARLVLLGDRDQLSSVDTGFVFGDLCTAAGLGGAAPGDALPPRLADAYARLGGRAGEAAEKEQPAAPLEGRGVELLRSYRFEDRPGIGELARALRRGDGAGALAVLDAEAHGEVRRHDPPRRPDSVLDPISSALDAYLASRSPEQALGRLEAFRILCATRGGRWGTRRLNALLEQRLTELGEHDGSPFYRARPILIEANDYGVKLFNGDLGVCWPVDEDGERHTWAFFPDPDGLRRVALAKLPPHSTAWAMTVHKSQGSEVDHVLLVLGDRDPGPGATGFLSRELVYTGVTRARREVDLVVTPPLLTAAAGRSSRRTTGLTDALAGTIAESVGSQGSLGPVE